MVYDNLTKEVVWGKFNLETMKVVHNGMVIAKGKRSSEAPTICPVWKDPMGYKDTTFKIPNGVDVDEVKDWIYYVHGSNSITKEKTVGDVTYLRSEYQCW